MTTQKRTRVPTRFFVLFALCGAVVLFGFFLTPYFTARPGHDQTSYLFEAGRVLSGIEPYGSRLTEVSPPPIIWFSAIPVLLARWIHGSPILFLRLLVVAISFGSVAWCVKILRRGTAMTNPFSIGLLACAILAIEFCIGPYNFGQRENLLVILLLPYVLAVASGAAYRLSLVERCGLGVAAGLAIWFKPQDTLILVGLELFLAIRARGLRRILTPEFLALTLTSLSVLIVVRVAAPLYITGMLPLLVDTYWAFGTMTTSALALSHWFYMLQVLALVLACFAFRRVLRDSPTSMALLACSFAGFVAFALQHTDWWYHAYPHQALFILALSYFVADLFYPFFDRQLSSPPLLRRASMAASACVVVLLSFIAVVPNTIIALGTHSGKFALDDYLAQYDPSTTVYVFSTREAALSFAYNRGLNWGSRFAHLWMMPAIIQNELGPTGPPAPFKRLPPETLVKLASLQHRESAQDLNYWQPTVVLVERCDLDHPCQGIEGKEFDMLSWFLRSPEFAAEWSHYQRETEVDNFVVYKRVQ